MSPENKEHYQLEKEAIHLLLTGIGDGIYSTEFGKFNSHDGESMESYYSRFYKMMNEMIRNNLTVATMQVNVQFLQQLQPEWSRFVTIFKKNHNLDTVSYHKLFDVLKQYQKEEQDDWLEETDEEIDEQELEVHYSYIVKIQEVPIADSGTDTEPLEQVDSNVILDSPDMCDNDIQTEQYAKECDDEPVVLANLITNLTLDTKENKKILKQLKKANTSLTQELKDSKSNLEESNTTRDSCLIALQSKQTELETYKTLVDRTIDYHKLEYKLNETLRLLA
ncbi:hypothetical protein Tco_1507246 [Tanacetum coccineum]